MIYFVYVLFFVKDKKFYTGYTKNIKLRLKQHKERSVDSTKDRGEFKLVYCEGCLNRQDAIHRGKYIKFYFDKTTKFKPHL